MYANKVFIQGWWERTVRQFIGLDGRIKEVGPFRMGIFNTVSKSVVAKGTVKKKWQEGGENLVEWRSGQSTTTGSAWDRGRS